MNQEGKSLGLQVNWLKTKVQATDVTFSLTLGSLVAVAGDNVEIVEFSRILVSTSITLAPVSTMSGNVLQ